MTPKNLTPDLAEALDAAGSEPLPVTKPNDTRVYFVVDGDLHERAMKALRHQQNVEAIRRGNEDIEAGEHVSVEEARRLTEEHIRQHAQ